MWIATLTQKSITNGSALDEKTDQTSAKIHSTIFEYFEDSLDGEDKYEAEAKKTLRAILDAFPPETDELPTPKEKPLKAKSPQGLSWRKRRDSNPR